MMKNHRSTFRYSAASISLLALIVAGCEEAATNSEITAPRSVVSDLGSSARWGAWSDPVNLTVVNSPVGEKQPTLSPDELSLYFSSPRPGGLGGTDLWVSHRVSRESPWQAPENLGASVNTPFNDDAPSFSHDGLLLFFHGNRPGGQGNVDIYLAHRLPGGDGWGPAVNLGTDVNTADFDAAPIYLPQAEDGRTNLYFGRGATAVDINLYSAAITRDGQTLGPAVPLTELNFTVAGITDSRPTIRRDGKEVIFFSTRPGGFGSNDLYVSTRQSLHSSWSAPVNAGPPLNTAFVDSEPSLSFDGGTLLFISNRPGSVGGNDIWMSTRDRN